MSKPIDPPDMPQVPLWDDGVPDDLSRPDASFHDDHVGGRVKADEAAKQRAVSDRFMQQQPKRIADESIKVTEAAAFRPTHDDEVHKRAQREANRQVRQGQGGMPAVGSRTMTQKEMDAARIEARVETLLANMQALHEAIRAAKEDIVHDGEGGEGGHEAFEGESGEAEDGPALKQAEDLIRMEREAKFQLQHLISGGVGLTFLADPKLTFRRLFDRIAIWPTYVRPGYRPESDQDIDVFLAWVFEPEEGYAGLETF